MNLGVTLTGSPCQARTNSIRGSCDAIFTDMPLRDIFHSYSRTGEFGSRSCGEDEMRLTGCCIVEFCAALRVLLPVSDRKQAQSNMPARSNDSWHPRRPLQRRMRSQFRFNYSLKLDIRSPFCFPFFLVNIIIPVLLVKPTLLSSGRLSTFSSVFLCLSLSFCL